MPSKPLSLSVAKPFTEKERQRRQEEEPKKQSREDWRKQKELEEARKLGNAPAEVDEEGKDINPHIPQYISSVPWYVDPSKRASLKHQRVQDEKQKEFSKINDWYKRGIPTQPIASKFRKGACANCGAMTHKKKDCLERPRKVGAKFSGSNIAPDEFVQPDIQLDFDGKRDRWNGFDPEAHREVISEYAKIEVAKQAMKAQKLQEELITGKMEEEKKDEDDDKYADGADMPGQNFDSKRRITVRNLRIREDTAKYLRNLDPNSAYYDPKTRSMRENPYKSNARNPEELEYAGDNFVRITGEAQKMAQTQMFAWEAMDKGVDIHLQSDPTKLEMLQQTYKIKKEDLKEGQKNSILEKYGGIEHLNAPPKELLLAQTEDYIEYNRQGNVIKGQEKAKVKSKYLEDIYINNHTAIWGSFWKDFRWGFACCHSFIKQSYCTGEAGKNTKSSEILIPSTSKIQEETENKDSVETKSLMQQHKEKLSKKNKKMSKRKRKQISSSSSSSSDSSSSSGSSDSSSSDSSSSDDEDSRPKKKLSEETRKEKRIKELMKKESERVKNVDRLMKMDERKRPYNSMAQVSEPTEEEMEVYFKKKRNPDDPMANFL